MAKHSSITQELESLHYDSLSVFHLFHQFHSIGGVEAMLRCHYEFDLKIGINSEFIIYHEDHPSPQDRVHYLQIESGKAIRTISQKLQAVTTPRPGRIAIYHLAWGFRFLCPYDASSRRILFLHTQMEGINIFLKKNSHFIDGILCVNSKIVQAVFQVLPRFPAERVFEVASPIRPLEGVRPAENFSNPIRLGYCGRVVVPFKRIDRIPDFCRHLAKLAVNFEMQVIGEGADRSLLEQADVAQLVLRGVLHGGDYWQALRELDVLVFFSDVEGMPISLLEALSQGVIPIFPRIVSGAINYVSHVSPDLLYPPGDLEAAARIVQKLSHYSPEEISNLRHRCRSVVKNHSLPGYLEGTFDFTKRIHEMPRRSVSHEGLMMKAGKFLSLDNLAAINKLKYAWLK